MDNPTANIALCYILALFLTARFTSGYFYGLFASLFGVVCVNFYLHILILRWTLH